VDPTAIEGAEVIIIGYSVLHPSVSYRIGDPETGEPLLLPKAVVFDESHFAKNHGAKRTKAGAGSGRSRPRGRRAAVPDRHPGAQPGGRDPAADRVDRSLEGLQGREAEFLRKYGSAGTQLLNELNTQLRRTCCVRRLKSEVLKDLPEQVPPAPSTSRSAPSSRASTASPRTASSPTCAT
jgi:hypothetical protein